jgi:hypothetical protein
MIHYNFSKIILSNFYNCNFIILTVIPNMHYIIRTLVFQFCNHQSPSPPHVKTQKPNLLSKQHKSCVKKKVNNINLSKKIKIKQHKHYKIVVLDLIKNWFCCFCYKNLSSLMLLTIMVIYIEDNYTLTTSRRIISCTTKHFCMVKSII